MYSDLAALILMWKIDHDHIIITNFIFVFLPLILPVKVDPYALLYVRYLIKPPGLVSLAITQNGVEITKEHNYTFENIVNWTRKLSTF